MSKLRLVTVSHARTISTVNVQFVYTSICVYLLRNSILVACGVAVQCITAVSVGHFNSRVGSGHALLHMTEWQGVMRSPIFVISDPDVRNDHIILMGLR